MLSSTKFLEQRLERLAEENQKLKTLRELYRLRSNFSGLKIALEKEEAQKCAIAGEALKLLIKKLDALRYAASTTSFAERVLEVAPDRGLQVVIKEVEKKPEFAIEMFKNVTGQSPSALPAKIDMELLRFVLEAPLVSALKEIAAKLPGSTQARSSCPVCNTKFSLSVYSQRKRYLLCKTCEARLQIDLLKCPNCGNEDSRKLGFLKLEDEPQFQIDYCSECVSYIKAVDEDAIGRISDASLFDLATLDFDALAKERGLGEKESIRGV